MKLGYFISSTLKAQEEVLCWVNWWYQKPVIFNLWAYTLAHPAR